MRLTAVLLLIAAVASGVFGWWGTSTVAGRERYDEMDGLYPLAAGLLAVLFGLAGVAVAWVAHRRARPVE